MPGTLFVVATPIGNLEDLTFRALRTLREVDLVAAEDTRRTLKLLNHYQVRKPLVSLREHNEARETPRLLARLAAGQSVALVSDAGTPGIADPGARLVRAARDAGVPVVPIPGPSALAAALSASGLPADTFVFLGFPPRSGSARQAWFSRLAAEPGTVVFFEAPHRIERTLGEVAVVCVKRPTLVAREISKKNESIGYHTEHSAVTPIGEFVVVVGPVVVPAASPAVDQAKLAETAGQLTNSGLFDQESVVGIVSCLFGVDRAAVAKAIKKASFSAKQQNRPSS